MKHLKSIFFGVLFLASIFSAYKIYNSEQTLRQYKSDIVELSHIEYGLLNVETWENLLADVIVSKLDDFDSGDTDKSEMKKSVGVLLKTLIDDYEKVVQKKNSGELFGSLKNSLYASAFADIKKDIPMLTDKVMAFLDVSNNKDGIKEYIVLQLKKYTKNSFPKTDYTNVNNIVEKYEGNSQVDTVTIIKQKVDQLNSDTKMYLIFLAAAFICFSVSLITLKNITKTEYYISILFSFLLLFLGVTLPMIEIDARISEISFTFLEENISFTNQVLFYKSKSIYEVVTLMMAQHKFDLMTVGILIFLFSVLFPVFKLLSTSVYLMSSKLKKNKIIQFFIFKTGKWSMADVFVIAIIMAFIGFEGIISEQLNQLSTLGESIDILTTNNSSILFGFYAFTAFVIVSLLLSQKIHNRISKKGNIS
jgi:hypothetical protein